LRQCFRAATASMLLFALTLFLNSRAAPALTFSYNEDLTLSRRTVGMPKADELKDMTRLLASLWEAAQRLPAGSERQDAFRQIDSFHRRVAALITPPFHDAPDGERRGYLTAGSSQ
jgi:acetoin utilization deacetylase AcuC-like enzyme